MIVHCDQCATNFRLDDAKVKDVGVKVRCSKCRHVFTVFPEKQKEDTEFDDLLKGLGPSAGPAIEPPEEVDEGMEQETTGDSERFTMSAGDSIDSASGISEFEAAPCEATFNVPPPGDDARDEMFAAEGSEPRGTEFDFGAMLNEPPPRAEEAAPPEFRGADVFDTSVVLKEDESQGDRPAREADSLEPDASADDAGAFFLDAFKSDSQVVAHPEESKEKPVPDADAAPQAPDFGDAFTGVASAEQNGGRENLPGTAAVADQGVAATDELPSLPLSARRRQHSVFPLLVTAISIAFLLLLLGGGMFFLKSDPKVFDRMGLGFIPKLAGLEVEEKGSVAVHATSGVFMTNAEAGEIFVVTGEALNHFPKARAAIQVRGLLYGAKGEVLSQKIAYCGNLLTQEQLKSLPISKIEARMANQFGDSLSNLGVPPGKGIPFVLVFTKVPAAAADYGVEIAGSTVAGK